MMMMIRDYHHHQLHTTGWPVDFFSSLLRPRSLCQRPFSAADPERKPLNPKQKRKKKQLEKLQQTDSRSSEKENSVEPGKSQQQSGDPVIRRSSIHSLVFLFFFFILFDFLFLWLGALSLLVIPTLFLSFSLSFDLSLSLSLSFCFVHFFWVGPDEINHNGAVVIWNYRFPFWCAALDWVCARDLPSFSGLHRIYRV